MMDSVGAWVSLAGGILTLVAAIVAITRYFTLQHEKSARDALERKNDTLAQRVAALNAEADVSARAGEAARSAKTDVDDRLRKLMIATGASGGSIYLPVRTMRGDVHGLAFLSLEPFSPETQNLRNRIIPLKSLAGRCFSTGQSVAVANVEDNPDHYARANTLSDYQPSTTLNLALRQEGDVIAVLQLLSRKGEAGFSAADIGRVEAMLGELPKLVAAIAQMPDYLRMLGLAGDGRSDEGTILYFDLSNSSLLLQELSSATALQMLNEYFETVCDVAIRHGGSVDNYMGDGALVRFNIPRRIADHERAAIEAGRDMVRAFEELKSYWVATSPRFANIHFRAAIATGPLLRATIGHTASQSLTVLGYPISVAAALCDLAPRTRNIILISEEVRRAAGDRLTATAMDPKALGKASAFTNGAFELT